MTNPAPRISPLVAALIAKRNLTNKAVAASIPVGLPILEEKKANEIVAEILDSSRIAPYEETANLADREDDSELRSWDDEEGSSSQVGSLFRLPPKESAGLTNPAIVLDESQALAVQELAQHQYGCLIGAAGTGKTTVQKYLLQELMYGTSGNVIEVRQLADNQGISIALVAFTGMAAQVIKTNQPGWMQKACKTIHGLLEFMPEEYITKDGKKSRIFMPSRHNMNKLDHNVVIIDEASMLGMDLWRQLIAALRPGTRIYMTGDLNQLPPIIGQPIFAYALSKWHVCELTKVHRQKEPGANRIVEVAHQILQGKKITFDVSKDNPDWRVIGFELKPNPQAAQTQILSILNQLRTRRINMDDPTSPLIYDPYRDRVMTAGNGFDDNVSSSLVQQAPLNEALSVLIQPADDEHPRFIIDAGRGKSKKFAVNLRVMATKNEGMDKEDRVTNGMTGIITEIFRQSAYKGDSESFGIEAEVLAVMRARMRDVKLMMGQTKDERLKDLSDRIDGDAGAFDSDEVDFALENTEAETDTEEAGGGLSSHGVRVTFDNGAQRTFTSRAGIDSLALAFCSTVAKCQGSQFDTAIIIVHHAQKAQLSREWLYTAVTRATKRVVILYTTDGLIGAISKQKIHGKTIAEKVERYRELANEGKKTAYDARLQMNIPLFIEGYDPDQPTHQYV